jgi:hypothetical protein
VLLGAIPGVYLGARVSARVSQSLVRRALVAVLTVSGLKLLNVSNSGLLVALALLVGIGLPAWAVVRRTDGFSRRPSRPGFANGQVARWGAARAFGARLAGPVDRHAEGSLSRWLAYRTVDAPDPSNAPDRVEEAAPVRV